MEIFLFVQKYKTTHFSHFTLFRFNIETEKSEQTLLMENFLFVQKIQNYTLFAFHSFRFNTKTENYEQTLFVQTSPSQY